MNTGGDFINNIIGGTGRVEKSGDDALTLSGSEYLYRRHHHQRRHADCHSARCAGKRRCATNNAVLELKHRRHLINNIGGTGRVENPATRRSRFRQQYYTGGTLISAAAGRH